MLPQYRPPPTNTHTQTHTLHLISTSTLKAEFDGDPVF